MKSNPSTVLRTLRLASALVIAAATLPAQAAPDSPINVPPEATAAEADLANLEALLEAPVIDGRGQRLGRVQDVLYEGDPITPNAIVIEIDDTGELVRADFATVQYHAGFDEVRLQGVARETLATMPRYESPGDLLSLKEQTGQGR